MYKHAAVGGTFDHFHRGHRHFLTKTFMSSEYVTVGVAKPVLFAHKPLAGEIESFAIRQKSVVDFLKDRGWSDRAQVVAINDIYGPTLIDGTIDALFIVSSNTENANLINKMREEKGLSEITINIVDEIYTGDGETLSSRRIRSGEVDREGNIYSEMFTRDLHMPESLRPELQKHFGKVVQQALYVKHKDTLIITVGDIVTANCLRENVIPSVCIYDYRTKRQPLTDNRFLAYLPKPTKNCENPPSTIASQAVRGIHEAIRQFVISGEKQAIAITGEEDLLALPAIVLAPLGSLVVYGSDNGMNVVTVDEDRKSQVSQLVNKFRNF